MTFSQRYLDYMRSRLWLERRAFILDRDKGICQLCKTARATEVHHRTYERFTNELPTDLISICDKCHGIVTAISRILASVPGYTRQQLAELLIKRNVDAERHGLWGEMVRAAREKYRQ